MIIVKLQGGLGNQLFQYAAGRSLAIKKKTELKLDTRYYETDKKRVFELSYFNIDACIADVDEIDIVTKKSIFRKLINMLFERKREKKMFADSYYFNPRFFDLPDNSYLEGFWQNEKYFKDIEQTLRKEFTLKKPFPETVAPLIDSINNVNSVSVHIRRGDYTQPKYRKIFYECGPEYYTKAIRLVSEKTEKPNFFIFSDDIVWAKTLSFPSQSTFIGPEFGLRNFEEFALMSMCKHNVTANSSFSWWGAWLNDNPEKIVVAPKKWSIFQDGKDREIIPKEWLKI